MARETINGISVPIPGTGEPADFVGDLRQIATDLSASIDAVVEPTAENLVARLGTAGDRGLAFCGDSNTASGVTGAGGTGVYNLLTAPTIPVEDNSWVGWALLASQGRWHLAVHAATPGITPAQWNTSFLPGVIAQAPYAAVDALGTNNVTDLAGQIAALTTMYDAFDQAGIKVIVCSIPPNTANTAAAQRLNRWKRVTAAERGYLFVDNYAAVVDSTTGFIAAAYDSDGTHWNAAGARAVGLAFGAAVAAEWADISTLALAQPSPADLINKPLLLVKSGFVPEDWTALGFGTASTAVNTVSGVVGKMFEVTQTADSGNVGASAILLPNLIAGHRYRIEYKYKLDVVGTAPTVAIVRLVIATGGGTTLCSVNTKQSVPLGTVRHEFVCPSGLSGYNYRLNMQLTGGGVGTKQSIGQVTATDLTASGLAA